jgi:tetratricopeptide (TPR) repeat protein
LKINCFFIVILLMHGWLTTFAQPDSILAGAPEQQVMLSWKWYYKLNLQKVDSASAMTQFKNAEVLFAQKGRTLISRQAWLMQYVYRAEKMNSEESSAIMLEAAEIAGEKNWLLIQGECQHYAGVFYFQHNMFSPAFEYMLKAQKVFRKEDFGESGYTLRYYDGLASCYYRFGEYEQSLRYLQQITKLPSYWNAVV